MKNDTGTDMTESALRKQLAALREKHKGIRVQINELAFMVTELCEDGTQLPNGIEVPIVVLADVISEKAQLIDALGREISDASDSLIEAVKASRPMRRAVPRKVAKIGAVA